MNINTLNRKWDELLARADREIAFYEVFLGKAWMRMIAKGVNSE